MVQDKTKDPNANGYDAYLGFVWSGDDYKIKVYDIPSEPERRAKLAALLQKVIEDLSDRNPPDTSVREVNKCKDCG